jgi:hypothetical protein
LLPESTDPIALAGSGSPAVRQRQPFIKAFRRRGQNFRDQPALAGPRPSAERRHTLETFGGLFREIVMQFSLTEVPGESSCN